MSKQLLFVLLAALVMAGCAKEDRRADFRSSSPSVTTANADCSPYRFSKGRRDYTMLRVNAELALKNSNFSMYSTFANFAGSEERQEGEKKARARADEVINKLDGLERQAEAAKVSDGKCFGEGASGEKLAEQYALTKEKIAEQRKVVAEGLEKMLARNKAIEEERTNFERWRVENPTQLVRHVGGMTLKIVQIAKRDIFGRPASKTVITVEATNTTTSKILKPRNQRVWGYENGSDIGGRFSIGASLTDSFGNDYKLTSVTPGFLGNESGGIRPGETVTFEVRFGDVPLENAKSVRLVVEPVTFGQQARTTFEISSEAFYGAVTKR